MDIRQHMIDTTKAAAADAFKCARAVPADKMDWQPLELGRSVLDQCRELAMCPSWARSIILDEAQPEWNEETFDAIKKEQEQWRTVDDCEAECNRRLEALFDVFRNLSDADLKKTKWLPYDGGRDFTMAEMMDYPRWNFIYHVGQISYIQTLYGDKEMH